MKGTILIVDDSNAIRQVLGFVLRKEGYDVVEARDGREALARLAEGPVDLVFCDLIMPNLDGLAFLKEKRGLCAGSAAPVVMLTTESQESERREGRELGVRAWIVKPFTPEQIVAVAARLLPASA